MTTRRWFLASLCVAGLSVVPCGVSGQIDDVPQTHGFRPFVSAGVSQFLGDLGEDNLFTTGPTIRAGLQTPGSSVALGLSYWGDVNRFRLTSLQLEFTQDLTPRRRVTPSLFAAVGHTWSSYLGTGSAAPAPGTSGAFGVGIEAAITTRVLVAVDARLRTDAGAWNAEWRIGGALSSNRALDQVQSRRTSFISSWMTAVGGPWVTVEPAWGLRVVRDGGVLALHMVHWRIPRGGTLAGYQWDTRAVIASAQTERDIAADHVRLRIGPALTAMGEGPDAGINLGALLDLVLAVDIGGMRVEGTAGWLGIRRTKGSDPSNQHGIMWSIGLGL